MRWQERKLAIGAFSLLAVVYILLTLLLPPDAHTLSRYNLSAHGAKVLSLTVAIPYIFIWFLALYGYLKCKLYAQRVGGSPDGKAFSKVADGLLVLGLSMPIFSVVSNVNLYLAHRHPHYLPSATIIDNYINLAVLLAAFYLIFLGSRYLRRMLQTTRAAEPGSEPNLLQLIFILLGVAYAYFTLTNPARQHPTGAATAAAYYLPDWLLFISIVVPYLVVLYWGFSAIWHLQLYRATVPGVLYKRALSSLWSGIFLAVLSVIGLRMLSSLTGWFENRTLNTILLIIYLLLILIGIAYALIARGAQKLTKIEEVV